jgi:hypothetical protein
MEMVSLNKSVWVVYSGIFTRAINENADFVTCLTGRTDIIFVRYSATDQSRIRFQGVEGFTIIGY